MRYILFFFISFIFQISLTANSVIDINEINEGDKGYGITVFKNNEAETFPIEVISIIKNFLPKQDLILIKMSGDTLNFTGIIAGMSGSPVYIKNKLAGAIAYGWSYAKEPLAGVTPIKNMLETLNFPTIKEKTEIKKNNKFFNNVNNNLKPIITPLIISGINEHIVNKFLKLLKIENFLPVQSGGNNSSNTNLDKLKIFAGAPISVILMEGDIDISAVGTITYIDETNKKLIGFGHPFSNAGYIDFPIAPATIHSVIARNNISFKLSSNGKIIGRLFSDNQSCISGLLDTFPELIKMNIKINDLITETEKEFTYRLVNHKDYSLLLILLGYYQSINTYYTSDLVNVDIKTKIIYEKNKELNLKNKYAIENLDDYLNLIMPFYYLYFNDIKYPQINEINSEISIENGYNKYFINRVALNKNTFSAGEEVQCIIRFKKDLSETYINKTISFILPENLEDGFYNIFIAGGESIRIPYSQNIETFEQLITYINEIPANNILRVSVYLREKERIISGQKYKFLPEKIDTIINDYNYPIKFQIKNFDFNFENVIAGQKQLMIRIQNKR
ncbi:MAG TPA: SpoIVB peptidase S55 domain-containing protein [bacterium]|nr:SpoIVB peptidase S55 domain-containing protein [bacterium]HOL48042.1 SpoIVB peptidase S55 domain-containing protein [bacterium]HPQ19766.1 SpoIVB peptidase S55 domain-containing protein [bacterium]